MPLRVIFIVLLLVTGYALNPGATSAQQYQIPPQDLSGMWRFALDRYDAGVVQQWFMVRLSDSIRLPGILQGQHFGNEITKETPWVVSLYDRYWYLRDDYKDYIDKNVKVPFLSQPPRHYLGAAWYQRDVYIQPNLVGRRVVLTLERPHWETTVWIDSRKIGSERSLVAPHVYDLGTLSSGRHTISIRVDNRMVMPYRPDAHSVSDSLGASWNGIVGKIQLSSTNRVWMEDAQVFPRPGLKSMLVRVRIGNKTGTSGSGTLTAIWPEVGIAPASWTEDGGEAEVEVPIRPEMIRWDEFHPELYPLRLWLRGNNVDEYLDLKVGLREFKADGKQFRLNGRQIIFRGTHSGGDFPLTGYPAMDVAYWKKLFELCRSWGLNHMRFHSWCPPEAAFEAADMVGFYLQPEPGMWNEINTGTPMARMLYEETDRMIKAYGNHPSFMLLSASNEPKGHWQEPLATWVDYYRKRDPRRLYTRGTGHTEREIDNLADGVDYLAVQRIGPRMLRRETGWFSSDYGSSLEDINVPVIAHEVGQWAAYPDFDIIKKFSGYLRPGNFEIFRDSAKEHGVLERNKEFARASGKFQLAMYKEEIEANLRTPGLGGFQLLDLHDYLGQGTALVGLLDAFWETKSYVSAEEFKSFCNFTVPLVRFPRRVFTNHEVLELPLEVSHFGPEPLEAWRAVWRIVPKGGDVAGDFELKAVPIGKNYQVGVIRVPLSQFDPGEYTLKVTMAPAADISAISRQIIERPGLVRGSTYFENSWNFWVYSADRPTAQSKKDSLDSRAHHASLCEPRPTEVLVTSSWPEAEAKLARGGKVLFSPRSIDLDWSSPPLASVPVVWNRFLGPGWGRMLGLWIDQEVPPAKNAMLARFSTNSYFDWQWTEIVQGQRAINLDHLPKELEPVVYAIDDWNRNYKLGVLFESVTGGGQLLVSSINVTRENSPNPVLHQFRDSLIYYMKSTCFQPTIGISTDEIRSLLFDNRIMAKLGAKAEINGGSAYAAIDGNPNTYVIVGDQKAPARDQIEMVVSLRAPTKISGFVMMARQNHREHEGEIRSYIIQASDDGLVWGDIARGELVSTFAPQRIELPNPITTQYLKLISLAGFGLDKTTSLAEFAIIYAGPKLDDNGQVIQDQGDQSVTPEIKEGPGSTKLRPAPSPRPPKPLKKNFK